MNKNSAEFVYLYLFKNWTIKSLSSKYSVPSQMILQQARIYQNEIKLNRKKRAEDVQRLNRKVTPQQIALLLDFFQTNVGRMITVKRIQAHLDTHNNLYKLFLLYRKECKGESKIEMESEGDWGIGVLGEVC